MSNDPSTDATVDPALAARLERLAARRATTPPSAPIATAPSPAATGDAKPRKRRHPPRRSRGAALALSVLSTGGLAYAFAATDAGTVQLAAGAQPAGIVSQPVAGAAPTFASPSTAASSSTPDTTSISVVNGDVALNKWGPVQVQVRFGADGSVVGVDALQTPWIDSKSVRINDAAVPRLDAETLTAQSSNVDTVSGATYTSQSYRESLQSAIDTARTAGITTLA